jgi:hypothetical protein
MYVSMVHQSIRCMSQIPMESGVQEHGSLDLQHPEGHQQWWSVPVTEYVR